ncbi:apoptosis-inducing factor 1, mitochondrial-like [Bradysia coprophila]|uniref:apoptosis-inducing factor 1, mitochondrial-like n=1 Tax=Bradysia coprophila TaxID=38358 RepID=UPI00187DCFE1|nr:apoptosis-inducing factor 1, mitochondrial-like [Bradysia coprophila]
MALLFRINVISKKLSSLCRLYTQTFDKQVILAPFACRQRNIFTNSCSIYFSKKKVDEVKAPKCPDFEQFFTKVKKGQVNKNDGEQLGNSGGDKRKSPFIQPPIFDDKRKVGPPLRSAIEKKALPILPTQTSDAEDKPPPNVQNKNELKPRTSDDKVKQPDRPQASEKKFSSAKTLDEFKQFALMPQSWGPKTPAVESNPSQQNKIVPPQQSQAIEDSKEKLSKTSKPPTDGDNNKYARKYVWVAAAAALLGTTLFFSTKKSNPDKPSIKINEDEAVPIRVVTTEVEGPLQIPNKVPYLIIGGGAASWSAFKAIKEHVPKAKVLVVSNEKHPPYKRPPLSKDLWSSGTNLNEIDQQIYLEPADFYIDPMQLLNEENGGISIVTNRTAKNLNLCERKVVLTDGTEIEYEECLLAIGSKPRNLLVFQTAPLRIRNKISFFRNLNDFQSAKEILSESESIAVIGGGFLASEISFALSTYANSKKLNVKIYQLFHENANMDMTLPQCLSDWTTNKLTDYGLSIMPNTQVHSVHMENSKLKLSLLSGQVLVVDHVIVAMGSQPDYTFIQMSGLKLASQDCGIAVNRRLEALPHLYVAGDAACLPGYLGKETETSYDHAIATGRIAGENMTGQKKSFAHQSMFSSNVAPKMSFQSIGRIDSELATVGVFSSPPDNVTDGIDGVSRGVVFYMKNDRVVGILLWNVLNKINVARQVIAEGRTLYDLNEVAKRFQIDETESII